MTHGSVEHLLVIGVNVCIGIVSFFFSADVNPLGGVRILSNALLQVRVVGQLLDLGHFFDLQRFQWSAWQLLSFEWIKNGICQNGVNSGSHVLILHQYLLYQVFDFLRHAVRYREFASQNLH